MIHQIDKSTINARLADEAEAIARLFLGEPNKAMSTRRQLRFGNHGSLAVEIEGPKAGYWYDHSDDTGGDLLALVQRETKTDFPGALTKAAELLGETAAHTPYRPAPRPRVSPNTIDADKQRKKAMALKVWETSQPAAGSVVELYLEQRNLHLPAGVSDIRFHPSCPRGADRVPAMVAAMRNVSTGELVGIHRTFLNADGTKAKRDEQDKAKAMLGDAGAIMLGDFADVGLNLFISEGIENALTCLCGGWGPVWALGSSGAIKRFPVLGGIEALTILSDADEDGRNSARECAARWHQAGAAVRIIEPRVDGRDLNNLITEVAP